MKLQADRRFIKDGDALPNQFQEKLQETIQRIAIATKLDEITGLKKMEGAKNAYRIKMGSYRIGFYLEGDTIVLSRVLNRKDIYKYFPKYWKSANLFQ